MDMMGQVQNPDGINTIVFLTCFASIRREYAPSPNRASPNLVFSKVTLMSQQVIPVLV